METGLQPDHATGDQPQSFATSSFKFSELVWMGPLLLVLLVAQLFLSQSTYLFVRHFWMDEVMFYEFAAAESLSKASRRVAVHEKRVWIADEFIWTPLCG